MKNFFLGFALSALWALSAGYVLASNAGIAGPDTLCYTDNNTYTAQHHEINGKEPARKMTFFERMAAKTFAKKIKKMVRKMESETSATRVEEKGQRYGTGSLIAATVGWLLAIISSSASVPLLAVTVLIAMVFATIYGFKGLRDKSNQKQHTAAVIGLVLSLVFWVLFIIGLGIVLASI